MDLILCAAFLLGASFYLWTAGTSIPLSLSGATTDPYNRLANAFLHLRLSIGPAPAGLLHLREPYNPAQNTPFQGTTLHDLVLYNGRLFITWGPVPVIVLLVPLHLLGFEPTSSLTASVFAIVGLGFALATLRVLLRRVDVPSWMSVIAALTLVLASTVPFLLRRPEIYEEEIAGGYCFAMAGVWLAFSAFAAGRASLRRVALMSLCIGLAAGCRAPLALIAVVLIVVYIRLRTVQSPRRLLMALIVPIGLCLVLLVAYNQVRFGSPLQNGAKYQLAGTDQYTAHFGDLSYVPPGLWLYALSPPQVGPLFPFIFLEPGSHSYPGPLPTEYSLVEPVGGLLVMSPIVIFLLALPWLWRRRPRSLGTLALPLLALAAAGIAYLLFLTFEFFSTTERYEVDFSTLLLFGALACWLALAIATHGRVRRLIRIGGALLALWSCLVGLATSFVGYNNLLALRHPGIWRTLEDIGSPLSRVLALAERGPDLAEVTGPDLPVLRIGQQAHLVIVSSSTRDAVLLAMLVPASIVNDVLVGGAGASAVEVRGPGAASAAYPVPPGGGTVRIVVRLGPGLNRLTLTPIASVAKSKPSIPAVQSLYVNRLSLAGES